MEQLEHVASPLDSVSIENRMAGADMRRRLIDDAIRLAFGGAPGAWRVTVKEVVSFSPPWWWVGVDGEGLSFEMSFRPSQQNAEVLRERLVDALRSRGRVE